MGAMEAIAADHPSPRHAPVHESLPSYYLSSSAGPTSRRAHLARSGPRGC
jgi:hypothetical protein